MNVMLYATFLTTIDGWLQREQYGVVVSQVIDPKRGLLNRVELRSRVPGKGFEFDGRLEVGSGRKFRVTVCAVQRPVHEVFNDLDSGMTVGDAFGSDPLVALWDMKLLSFEVGDDIGGGAFAKAVFECPGERRPAP